MKAAPDHRRRELAQIHIAKVQLGMDDDTYRAMLWAVGRVHSAADLDYAARQSVLEHLRACGFKPTVKNQHGKRPKVGTDRDAQVRKLEALLADRSLPWTYITSGKPSMVQRICRVARIEWATAEQLGKLIAALSIDQRRRKERV